MKRVLDVFVDTLYRQHELNFHKLLGCTCQSSERGYSSHESLRSNSKEVIKQHDKGFLDFFFPACRVSLEFCIFSVLLVCIIFTLKTTSSWIVAFMVQFM